MDVYMACDCCGNIQQVPLPTKQALKQVLLDFRLSLPQTITNPVECLTRQVKGPGQRRQFGQAAVILHPSAVLPPARQVNHLRRDEGQSTARVQLTHAQLSENAAQLNLLQSLQT